MTEPKTKKTIVQYIRNYKTVADSELLISQQLLENGQPKVVKIIEYKKSSNIAFEKRLGGIKFLEFIEKNEVGVVLFSDVRGLSINPKETKKILDRCIAIPSIRLKIKSLNIDVSSDEPSKNKEWVLLMNLLEELILTRKDRIKATLSDGIKKTKERTKTWGRPPGKEPMERFLAKAKTQRILELLKQNVPEKEIYKKAKASRTLIRKVREYVEL